MLGFRLILFIKICSLSCFLNFSEKLNKNSGFSAKKQNSFYLFDPYGIEIKYTTEKTGL